MATPFLSTLVVHFLNRLTCIISWLLRFMGFIRLEADPHRGNRKRPSGLTLQVTRQDNLQVSSMVQILRALTPLLSFVEQLTLTNLYGHTRIGGTKWREFLRSFGNVKVLHVRKDFIEEVSRFLHHSSTNDKLRAILCA
jgi:hypothetical protein